MPKHSVLFAFSTDLGYPLTVLMHVRWIFQKGTTGKRIGGYGVEILSNDLTKRYTALKRARCNIGKVFWQNYYNDGYTVLESIVLDFFDRLRDLYALKTPATVKRRFLDAFNSVGNLDFLKSCAISESTASDLGNSVGNNDNYYLNTAGKRHVTYRA